MKELNLTAEELGFLIFSTPMDPEPIALKQLLNVEAIDEVQRHFYDIIPPEVLPFGIGD